MKAMSIAIIGAGLAGMGLAHALLEVGFPADRLVIFEAQYPGAGASGLPAALMHPVPGRSLYPKTGYWTCFNYSHRWLHCLQRQSSELICEPRTLLRPALDSDTLRRFQRSFQRLPPELQVHIQPLNASELQALLPDYRCPGATWRVQPALLVWMPRLVHFLSEYIHHAGVTMVTHPVESLVFTDKGWTIHWPRGETRVEQVVLAPGKNLGHWFPNLPLDYIRGEVLVLKHPHFMRQEAGISASGYFMPLGSGRALAGPTFYTDPLPRSQAWSIAEIQRQLQPLVPAVVQAEVEHLWSGIRTVVRHDREPLVGPVPGQSDLFVFAAFASKGLLQIPWLAAQLARHFMGHTLDLPMNFHSQRLDSAYWRFCGPCD